MIPILGRFTAKQGERMSDKSWHDKIHGGRADKMKPSQFDPEQLKKGIKHEMEHTDDRSTAEEIAMDHLAEDPKYYDHLKEGCGWANALVMLEAGGEEFVDYQGPIHPHLQGKRDELSKTLKWVADGLRNSHYTPILPLADKLEKVADMPSERVMDYLKQVSDDLHKNKRDLKKFLTSGAADETGATEHAEAGLKAIEDALIGIPSVMKAAGTMQKSTMSDKDLWQKKSKGYVDDKTGEYRRLGTTVHPTGMQPPTSAQKKAAAAQAQADQQKSAINQKIKPFIRKKNESAWADLEEAINEAPLDFKKSFKKAQKALTKAQNAPPPPGINKDVEVEKIPKGPKPAEPIRGKHAEGDPTKSTNAEQYHTDNGDYFLIKDGGQHKVLFLSLDLLKKLPARKFTSRQEAVDFVLQHHDKVSAGLGEKKEIDAADRDHDFH